MSTCIEVVDACPIVFYHLISFWIILFHFGSCCTIVYHLKSSEIISHHLMQIFGFTLSSFLPFLQPFKCRWQWSFLFISQNTSMAFLESQDHFSSADGGGSFGHPCASETFGGCQCRPDIGVLHASDPWKGHSCETMLRRAIMKCSMKEFYKWSLPLATI